MANFIWTAANLASATKHGVTIEEAQQVAAKPLLRERGAGGTTKAMGQAKSGRYIEVIYRLAADAPIDWSEVDVLGMDDEDAIFIFHARTLTDSEKRRLRRRLR